MVKENLSIVEQNIQKACARSGRDRREVQLIAVSKTKPVEMLMEAYDCQIRDFGENKPQEIREKFPQRLPESKLRSFSFAIYPPMQKCSAMCSCRIASCQKQSELVLLYYILQFFSSGNS